MNLQTLYIERDREQKREGRRETKREKRDLLFSHLPTYVVNEAWAL